MKGKSSCPMCRASMCFRGITKLKKEWYHEKREETYMNLVVQMFDELMEEYDDIILQCLEVVQNRYEYTTTKYPDISCDMLDIIMRVTWVDIDYLMNNPDQHIYEPKTFERYLMVSKYEKKILVNCNEVKKRTNRDVYDNRISSYFFWYVFD
jgi:hypothetical protein